MPSTSQGRLHPDADPDADLRLHGGGAAPALCKLKRRRALLRYIGVFAFYFLIDADGVVLSEASEIREREKAARDRGGPRARSGS